MRPKKKVTPPAGAPVVGNRDTMAAGPRAPRDPLFDEGPNERSGDHE